MNLHRVIMNSHSTTHRETTNNKQNKTKQSKTKNCIVAVEVLFGQSAVAKDLVKTVKVSDEYKREMQGIAEAGGVKYDAVLTAKWVMRALIGPVLLLVLLCQL